MKKWCVFNFLIISILLFSPFYSFSQNKNKLLVYDKSKVCNGNILFYTIQKCQLIDREGNVLLNFPGSIAISNNNKKEIFATIAGYLISYDKDLETKWRVPYSIHHELLVTPDNNIMFHSNDYKTINKTKVRFDNIISVDTAGKELFKWSTYNQRRYLMSYMMKDTDIFRYKINRYLDPDTVLFRIAPGFTKAEYFHMNSIQFIPENESAKKNPVFKKGNILLSFHNSNDSLKSFIAVVDPLNFKILWHYVQKDKRPIHTPTLLPNGHILMYVNSDFRNVNDSSMIEEIDPLTKKVVWNYVEKFPKINNSRCAHGSCQRLSNGNTLITNIDGFIYEVTPEKTIVWLMFIKDGSDMYRAYLYPKDKFNWLINEK